jgi:hypothetical protein
MNWGLRADESHNTAQEILGSFTALAFDAHDWMKWNMPEGRTMN